MGLFSSSSPSPALNEDIEEALSPAYRADVVGKREYASGLSKVAKEQQGLVTALNPGEKLQVIVPCLGPGTYEGLAVLTQRRVMEFKGSIRKQMTLEHIADVEAKVHPRGFAIVSVKGLNYIPYSEHMRKAAFDEYMRNYIQFSMSGVEVARHFVALVDGIRTNPNAAI